ncbi:MAG TPA: PIN domain-containing protein [Anaerolineae bacterium]|nr:PIN domain-containing protein [Anaerolineae bacterium]HQH37280.1 PIN domain-containing protein [Anaerolineae bacterium]
MYTVDASVFVNAFNSHEPGYANSYRFLEYVKTQAFPIIVPTLMLPEVAAAIGRGSRNATLARKLVNAVGRLSNLIMVPLDDVLAQQAADVAADHRLRGSDAVYVAVALRFGSTLVTLDQEQATRVAAVLTARDPLEALTILEGNS